MGHYFGALHGFGAQKGAPFYRLWRAGMSAISHPELPLFYG